MRRHRTGAVAAAAAGAGLLSLTMLVALPQATSAAPAAGQSGPAAYGHRVADAPAASPVDFSLVLNLRDAGLERPRGQVGQRPGEQQLPALRDDQAVGGAILPPPPPT